MRVLTLFLFFPILAFAQQAPSCGDLEGMIGDLEQSLMNKTAGEDCNTLTSDSLLSDRRDDVKRTVESYRCSELDVIEGQIKLLEAEMAILQGFEKLKNDIRTEKDRTASSILRTAQEAGENFTNGVITAQSLELLFSEASTPEFVSSLRDALNALPPEQRINPEIFHQKVRTLCGSQGQNSNLSACHESFHPNAAALRDINQLISQGPITAEHLRLWRNALAIQKRDGTAYSFSELHQELKAALPKLTAGELTLTREELRAIRGLPDFQNEGNTETVRKLRDAKDDFKAHALFEEFKFLAGDLKGRQEFEIKNKVSLAWKNVKSQISGLSDEQKESCESAFSNNEKAAECHAALKVAGRELSTGSLKTHLESLSDSVDSSLRFIASLEDTKTKCLTPEVLRAAKERGEFPAECSQKFSTLSADLSKKQNEVLALNALKEKIGSSNQRLMTFRNFAIQSMVSGRCANLQVSKVGEFCEDLDLKISREAIVLSSDVAKLAILAPSTQEEVDIKDLCDDENLKSYEEKLCASLKEPAEPQPEPPKAAATVTESSSSSAEVEGPRNTAVRDAWVSGTANLAGTVIGGLFPQRSYNPYAAWNYNPYQYNYSPYTFNPGISSISDSLLGFNSRYYGSMGFYMPTFGLPQYTAFPVYNAFGSTPMTNYFTPYTPLSP